MLNQTGSDTPQPLEDVGQRMRARPAPARALNIDPTWRAGRKLHEARMQLGLSLEDVQHRIRVRREFLEALEAMNAKQLPGKAYALAYLRSYAQMLGLDAQALVEQFQDECALSREDALPQIRSPESRPDPRRPWLVALAVGATAAAFVGWRALQSEIAAAPEQPEIAAAPSSATSGGAVVRSREIEIRALAEAWLEVRGPDGTVFLSRTMRPGETYRPDASPGWTLHARDGGAFEVVIDGAPAGPLGDALKPVLGRQLDSIQPLPIAPQPLAAPEAPRAMPPRAAAPAPSPAETPAAPPAEAAPAAEAPVPPPAEG